MTGEGIRKKRDPIFSVCFVVFLVACVGVVGSYINDHYIEEDNTKAAFGDKVSVNYVGTYYAAYGEEGAVVFDTTYSSIGKNDDVLKSYDFSSSSYKPIDVTIGNNSFLQMFEDSIIGHKVGDKYSIEIPADQGYSNVSSGAFHKGVSTTFDVPVVQEMTKAQFDAIYDVKLTAGTSAAITTAYGWPGTAMFDSVKNLVTITNMPVDEKYEYIGNEDSKFGKVYFTVNSVGKEISVTSSFEVETLENGTMQMLKVNVDGTPIYVTEVSQDGKTMSYKTCDERCGIKLYFEIEIVSINA